MRNIILVIKHEIITILQKRSFWISSFLFPLLILGFNVGIPMLVQRSTETAQAQIPSIDDTGSGKGIGYVDQAGLVDVIPADLRQGLLLAYPDEAAAKAAVEGQVIDEYLIIPTDYMQIGKLVVVQRNFKPFSGTPTVLLKYVIDSNLTGDSDLAAALNQPMQNVETHDLSPKKTNGKNNTLTYLLPMSVLFIFFFLLVMSSGFMLQSVSREKENRTMEILLLSLRPRDLMVGKIVGMSIIALFQILVWMGGGLLVLNQKIELLRGAAIHLPPGFVFWALLFFLLGYLLYASLMAGIGAMAPTAQEGAQFTIIVMLPLMIPVMLNSLFILKPDGPLALAFSLFPLTAPSAMIARLVATQVPVWQIVASLAGLVVTTGVIVVLSSRLFRGSTLLSNASINWRSFFQVLRQHRVE